MTVEMGSHSSYIILANLTILFYKQLILKQESLNCGNNEWVE